MSAALNMFRCAKAFAVMSLVLLLVACASPTSTQVIGQVREAIDPADVQIYAQEPDDYEAIAFISTTSDGSWRMGEQAKMDAVFMRLKEAAAKLGANGVLIQATGERRGNSVHLGTGTGGRSGNFGYGINVGRSFGLTDKTAEALAIYVPPAPEVDPEQVAQGKREFMRCIACHAMSSEGRTLSGPHLEGIIGRQVAATSSWDFPDHVAQLDFVWTEDRMDRWLQDPQAMVPQMCLPFNGLASAESRAALIAYLQHPQ